MGLNLYGLKRRELVEQLHRLGIKDKNVLKALNTVKRELFVGEEFKRFAYDNNALPISSNQTISQPYTIAFMTELLAVKKGDSILEVGTGSGYQAAILCEMDADVYSVERLEELSVQAKALLDKLNYKVKIKCDDGSMGWKEYSPFDGIIVTAGSPKVPKSLTDQLNINGRLVIPVGDRSSQRLIHVRKVKTKDNKIKLLKDQYKDFRFVPLLGEEGW
ncbi:MAG: protein-L-isoaspartate(D-aspartate) O-methyltransferase [Ignavibacteria bacterium]|nr:protein-L-isoaspartate(D-aspartate) O-methyltransferase [Bacteroidota bacterium]MBL7128521.1 protein-L-isoaspartate(D-aspartate) O-methyltransferase [Ignavibacteria bacterium]